VRLVELADDVLYEVQRDVPEVSRDGPLDVVDGPRPVEREDEGNERQRQDRDAPRETERVPQDHHPTPFLDDGKDLERAQAGPVGRHFPASLRAAPHAVKPGACYRALPVNPTKALAVTRTARSVWSVRSALGRLRSTAFDSLLRVTREVAVPDLDERLARIVAGRTTAMDAFGFDAEVARYALAAAAWVYRYYFRAEIHGTDRIPDGRVMLVANHSGQVPLDGLVIGAGMILDAEPPRLVRSMVEKWALTLPYVGELFTRCGQVLGVPENCRWLLERDEAILVFPEGVRGISKTWDQRYRLTDFGLGFMRLALETGTPIVPVAVIGAEEQYVNLYNSKTLARFLGTPVFPLIPQALVPILGWLPAPTKYRVYVGEPMRFQGDPDDEDQEIERKVWVVRTTIQSMLNRGLKDRKSVFF
jgi:1-acyl-sn-glycerol-3-phosphate acyltransferase